jgi:Arc/MetJ-type ribon-helix-helix transcriptional regulator
MARLPEDDEPRWLRDYKSINVDIDGLHTFAGAVDTEVEKNFQPHTRPLMDSYAKGVQFGASSKSGDVQAAKLKYHDCLVGVTEQLTAYANASKILVDAIRLVAKNYGSADALSAAQATEVEAALGNAVVSAQQAQAAADAAAAQRAAQPNHGSARAI